VSVLIDPFGASADNKMPFLAEALNPDSFQRAVIEACPEWVKTLGEIEVRSIQVTRYKPGRRCLIQYELATTGTAPKPLTVLGKVRAKGLDR